MRATNTQLNLSDDRQKEYQRQQERLKAMASNADKIKSISADIMIENLLKDSFKKPIQTPSQVERQTHQYSDLPVWLNCDSVKVPAQYKYFWSLVQSTTELADTQKVSQLLLTSGLHVDLLGFIWNLASKSVPGHLTKQEFYIVLALVGLAQTGCTFNNLGVLNILPGPSVPVLQAGVLQTQTNPTFPPVSVNSDNSFQQFQSFHQPTLMTGFNDNEKQMGDLQINSAVNETNVFYGGVPDIKEVKIGTNQFHGSVSGSNKPVRVDEPQTLEINKEPYKNFPCIGSSPTREYDDDFSEFQSVLTNKSDACDKSNSLNTDLADDFTEFQSANVEHIDPYETVVITQKREIPKIPLPKSLSGKLTNLKSNILKISPESERKLKVLSQSESLSSLPESKISSTNKVSTSISVLGSNHGIGSRLANHSLSAKLDRPKHHKHHKIKISPNVPVQPKSEEDIILGIRPINIDNLMPKCCPKKAATTFVLKETKIQNDDIPELAVSKQVGGGGGGSSVTHSGETTRQIEIPMLGTFNETVLPTQTSGVDLMSVQEDKYSALREIEIETGKESSQTEKVSEIEGDDFGDFLSADITPPPPVAPVSIVNTLDSIPVDVTESTNTALEDEEKDNWGDWSFNVETNSTNITVISNVGGNNEEKEPPVASSNIFDSFDLLSLNESEMKPKDSVEQQIPELQSDIFNTLESNPIIETTPSTNGDLYNFAMFDSLQTDKSNNLDTPLKLDPLITTNQSEGEFWDFLASDVKPPDDLSRHGSLPSLDLKISPTEETDQEVVWRKCLDSCQNLIQEGYEIFNNVNIKSILDEVFACPKTVDYLNYLNIVYQVSKRVGQNYSEISSVQEDIERLWGRLQQFCYEYNIKLKGDKDIGPDEKPQCNICLGYINSDCIKQGSGSYHPSCANLWINFIETTLPFST